MSDTAGGGGASAGDASSDAGSAAAADTDTVTSSALEWMHHLPSTCAMFMSQVHIVNKN